MPLSSFSTLKVLGERCRVEQSLNQMIYGLLLSKLRDRTAVPYNLEATPDTSVMQTAMKLTGQPIHAQASFVRLEGNDIVSN